MSLWQKQSKCNAEFFALTYGALVAELLRDLEDSAAISTELESMGHSIGIRCIEEVLAKATMPTQNFTDAPEICSIAFRMFFGIPIEIKSSDATQFSITFADNPLATFVELPENSTLEYSGLLAGMIRGMLEMLQFDVKTNMTQTVLAGGATNEISVSLQQILQEGAGEDYHEE